MFIKRGQTGYDVNKSVGVAKNGSKDSYIAVKVNFAGCPRFFIKRRSSRDIGPFIRFLVVMKFYLKFFVLICKVLAIHVDFF